MLSPVYLDAIARHDVAMLAYREALDAYFARRMSDSDFIKARKARDMANAEFDRAYAEEQARG